MRMLVANLLIGLMCGGVVSAQHRIEADEQSLAHGIAVYSIERLGKVVTVVTEDAEGLVTGRYVLEFDTPKGIAVRFDDLDTSLEMFWNPMNAEFSLRDQRTGAEGTARPAIAEDGKPSFSKNDSDGVMRRHEQGTGRAFFVLHQTMINLGLYNQGEAKPRPEVIPGKPTEPAEPGDHLLVTLCPPSCTGPSMHSGFFVNSAASLCCDNARSYLQGLCSNIYCFGCCRTLSCDSACVLGDGFGCICSHRGTACGPPLTACDDDWPPECT